MEKTTNLTPPILIAMSWTEKATGPGKRKFKTVV